MSLHFSSGIDNGKSGDTNYGDRQTEVQTQDTIIMPARGEDQDPSPGIIVTGHWHHHDMPRCISDSNTKCTYLGGVHPIICDFGD